MKKYFLSFVFLVLIVDISFSQRKIQAYTAEYSSLKDSVFEIEFHNLIDNKQVDSSLHLLESTFIKHAQNKQVAKAAYLTVNSLYELIAKGEMEKSILFLKKLLPKYEQNYDTSNVHYAKLVETLAFAYKFVEELGESKTLYEKAISILENNNVSNLQILGQFYQSYGSLALYMGDVETGYKYLQKALKIMKAYDNKYAMAFCYLELARATGTTNQEKLSYEFNKKAIDIIRKTAPEGYNHVVATSNQANNALNLKKYNEAKYWAEYADSILNKYNYQEILHRVHFSIIANKGLANKELKNYEEADKNFRLLLQLIEKYYPNTPFVGDAYNEIAANFDMWEKHDSALANYNKVIEYNPDNNIAYQAMSNSFLKLNKFEEAIQSIKKALSIITGKEVKDSQYYSSADFKDAHNAIDYTYTYAKIYAEKFKHTNDYNDLKISSRYAFLTDTLFTDFLNTTLIGKSDIHSAKKYHELAELSLSNIFELYGKFNDEQYLENAFYFINRAKAISLATQINQNNLSESNPELYQTQIELIKNIRFLENQILAANQNDNYLSLSKLEEELFNCRIKAFETSLQYQNNNEVKRALVRDNKPIPIGIFQSNIPKGKAVITYYLASSSLYGICISQNDFSFQKIDSINDISKLIRSFYKNIKTSSSQHKLDGKQLYTKLIEPFNKNLKGIKKLLLIPDGKLSQIPFELFSNKEGKLLIEDYSISYHYSALIWYYSKPKTNTKKFLAIAPVFDNSKQVIAENSIPRSDTVLRNSYREISDNQKLTTLRYSKEEVESAHNMFSDNNWENEVLLGKDANEEALKKKSKNKTIIHIATHGVSSIKNTDLSGLYFHKNESTDITNDGFLYAKEIYDLNLDSTDLVVLSACKTGTGKIVEGEGVMALPRGFIYAGVPNIIVSLWKIHDEKTKNLMLDFYKEFFKGKDYDDALRQAKLNMIKNGELPIDWSGIVLIGR